MKKTIAVLSVTCAVLLGLLLRQIVKTSNSGTSNAISTQQQEDAPLYLVRAQKMAHSPSIRMAQTLPLQ